MAQGLLARFFSRTACVALGGCIVTPLVACIRRIERLAVISVAASALVVVFLAYAVAAYRDSAGAGAAAAPLELGLRGDGPLPGGGGGGGGPEPRTVAGMLHAMSVINLSFNCHFNLLPLYYALPGDPAQDLPAWKQAQREQQRQGRMRHMIGTAAALALVVYALVGTLGFLAFDGRPSGDVFADYATLGPFGQCLDDALALAQLVTLPLLVHEGVREAIDLATGPGSSPRATAGAAPPVGLWGAGWCVLMTLTAVAFPDTSAVLGLVSAFTGPPLMTVFPLWMLLRAGGGHAWDWLLLGVGVAATVAFSLSAIGALA